MDTTRALLVDAFTTEPCAGNAAGVVPDADDLTDGQMQAIASELGASETAFLCASAEADHRIRYFTPTTEVDLCGHATIASHAHLAQDGVIGAGTHTLETNVGVLEIEVEADGTVWMTQNTPRVREVDLDYDRVAEALGIPAAALRDVGQDLPLARATTGLPFLIVPVNFLEQLGNADPDMAKVEEIADEVDATGIYAFTFDALDAESTLHGRMWAPGAGVPEDPVTGTASGACGGYLRHYGAFKGEVSSADVPAELRGTDGTEAGSETGAGAGGQFDIDEPAGPAEGLVFEQGHFVDRPGKVRVRVSETVQVGGRATTTLNGELAVPETEEDDILEA